MIKGYVFDLDGTLLNSLHAWNGLAQRYLRTLGMQTEEDLDETCKTMSLAQSAAYLKDTYHLTEGLETIIEGFNTILAYKYVHELVLKDGVSNFLKRCKDHNIKMCVLTASNQELAIAALKRCGILDYFTFVLGCEQVGLSKQEPELFEQVMQRLGVAKEQCIFIEDSLHVIRCLTDHGYIVKAVYDRCNQEDWLQITSICKDVYISMKDMEVM